MAELLPFHKIFFLDYKIYYGIINNEIKSFLKFAKEVKNIPGMYVKK